MPRYKIVIHVEAGRIDALKNRVREQLGPEFTAQIAKIESNPSRAARLTEAESLTQDARSIVENLKEEIDTWKDNMPEALQSGTKADELDECSQALEEIQSNLDNLDFASVTFPSMM